MFNLIIGKIGSGKSTISQYLRKRGYLVIDTDQLMKDLFAKIENKTVIVAKYGKEAFTDRNTLSVPIIEKCLDSEEDYSWFRNLIEQDYIDRISVFNKMYPVFIETAVILPALYKFYNSIDHVFEITCDYYTRKQRVIRRYEDKIYGGGNMSEADKQRIDKTETLQSRFNLAIDELQAYNIQIKHKEFVNDDNANPQEIATQIEYIINKVITE